MTRTERIARRLVAASPDKELNEAAYDFHKLCRAATDRLRLSGSPGAPVSFDYSLRDGLTHEFSLPSISGKRYLDVKAELKKYDGLLEKAAKEYAILVAELVKRGLPHDNDYTF